MGVSMAREIHTMKALYFSNQPRNLGVRYHIEDTLEGVLVQHREKRNRCVFVM